MESKIVDQYVEKYIRSLLPEHTGLLEELEAFAALHRVPIIHPEIAQYMKVFLGIVKPVRILEIGTAIGYSASIFATSMQSGHIDTIELNEVMAEKAKETFERLNESVPNVSVSIHLGDAKDVIKTLEGPYDMIFIDAAKGHYQTFFETAYDLLSETGVIVSDNVLYKGMVATNEYLVRRKITIVKRMRKYLEFITTHPNLETTVLTMGDGLAVSYKKGKTNE
ncbi:O-methyltransferase [Fusibacter ferrireducens]|uniref:tRNA 5-hydroxyuridine methyltransferase n=1 Tax=Fusibacter ferrireducens TaxID=2785058 RepID=A0ABR9ZTC6_9FIRM|nr:O-methyltransferase [Fusibacter ferrireducens]MBF4693695.1 O-methyltransferase [Fusibacter ferrireducens]